MFWVLIFLFFTLKLYFFLIIYLNQEIPGLVLNFTDFRKHQQFTERIGGSLLFCSLVLNSLSSLIEVGTKPKKFIST